jgi:hypothetical protein
MKRKWTYTFAMAVLAFGCLAGVVQAKSEAGAANRCPAFVTWQDWLGGARVHAYVDFRASDLCNGRHVRRAYIRFTRPCGPSLDTGRIYTSTASSPSDTRLYSYKRWVWDSLSWSCTTYTWYGYEYF